MAGKAETKNAAAGVGLFAALAAFFMKFKFAIFGLLKAGWLLKSASMLLLSFGIYAQQGGWRWAVTLIALIYVHEMGHYAFMKVKGLKPQAPMFVPFVGAYVAMTKLPEDPITHAWVAYAGPLVGGLASVALYWLGVNTGHDYLIMAASTGFFLNLLQLVPVRPFDGGFIAEGISKWLMIPGILILVVVALNWHALMLTIITFVAVLQTIHRFRAGSRYDSVKVSIWQRVLVTLAYFGLAWALAYYYWQSESLLGLTTAN